MSAGDGQPSSWPGFLRRHKVVAVLVALLLVLGTGVTAYGLYLNSQLGDIARFESSLRPGQRAPLPSDDVADARNILLLGTDKGTGSESIEQELADGEWTTGSFRSDTVMIVHVPPEQNHAYLVSIPRDTLVRVPGHGKEKINSAFSFGGPDLTIRAVENLTGVYIDHVAMVDWAGFKQLTHAIGGVKVTIDETFTDPHNDRTWRAGTHVLEGKEALQYVRTRYGLEQGDFDRIDRQQNFLRSVLQKMLSNGTLANPLKLTALLRAVADATTVDARWSTGDMRRLALNLRGLGRRDVEFLTAPVKGTAELEDVGSVVLLRPKESEALWDALRNDDMHGYLDRYGGDRLPGSGQID